MSGPVIGSLFSGSGMLDEGVRSVLGGDVAWHAEVDPAACKVLAHRYPDVPNLGDITTVDWSTVEPVDVITGGSPCQDVSHAGKRAGMRAGTRSGLWARMCDAIESLRPSLVVWENVRGVLSAEADSALEPCPGCVGDGDDGAVLRALGRVLGDLAELGYDAQWHGLRAADVGAPHGRFRVFVVATDAQRGGRDGRASDARRGTVRGTTAAGTGSVVAADAANLGHEWSRPARLGRAGSADGSGSAPDATRDGRDEGRAEPARIVGGPDAAECGDVAADTDSDGLEGIGRKLNEQRHTDRRGSADVAWGQYEPAIRRWEAVTGRPAPAPTESGARGGQRLSPRLTEWMMGWPHGWVTDVPGVSRNEALKICGNGVVPQQAAEAIRRMLRNAARAAA